MERFPKKDKAMGIMSFLFISIIILYVYFLFLFWVKFNILQTLGMLLLLGLPATIIMFKTVVNVQIEI
jgi:hypothetical protein